jgi:hypothetical protein
MRWRPLKLSQILETMPGWSSSMRTATGPHKGRLAVVSIVLPRRAKDYLANRAPLAIAPFKASKTERERIAIDLFEVFERGSVWEIDGVRSLADWDEGPGRTARVVVWGRGTIDLGRCLLAVDVENGEVLAFDEEAFVSDPDGWTRAELKQDDVMAVEFVLGTPDPPNNNVERWLQELADARWGHKRCKQWKVYGGEAP